MKGNVQTNRLVDTLSFPAPWTPIFVLILVRVASPPPLRQIIVRIGIFGIGIRFILRTEVC